MSDIEKLKIIRDVVANVPDEKWDMTEWKCGSVGCAIGHSAERIGVEFHNPHGFLTPVFGGADGFEAVAMCLGVTETDAEYLFDPEMYDTDLDEVTRDEVLSRLDHFIKNCEST